MSTRLVIDEAGRVLIPKMVRDELHLEPGDALELESIGEQITLRPVRATGALSNEQGVWVFYSGTPLSNEEANEFLQETRRDRDRDNLNGRE
jgi:AbrB family looped-hinge helix DNA binding protein